MQPTKVQIQLVAAAAMWLIGASILLVRGVGYIQGRYWHAWILALGLALGVVKAQLLLDRVATKAVLRIQGRANKSVFGFFSVRSWMLLVVMMGGGILLRQIVVHPGQIGAGIMGAIYVGIGAALLLADRVFWRALFKPLVAEPSVVEPSESTAASATN